MTYSLYLPRKGKKENQGQQILAADIGGTKTNLGLFEVQGDALVLLREDSFPSQDHHTFEAIVRKFLKQEKIAPPAVLSIGVAGPVLDNQVKLTNLSWELSADVLAQSLEIAKVTIINDLEATAYGLAGLAPEDVVTLFEPTESIAGNMAIIAPGTGLGEAGIFWDGESHRPFATEGGHSDFSPRTAFDFEMLTYLQQEDAIVSWEHLVAGPGIYRIYSFLRDVKGYAEPDWLKENFKNNPDYAAVISHAGLRELDAACMKTMELFVSFMAREATNLVLKHKATGGLLLGGGIPPRIYPLLRTQLFRAQFIQNARQQELLENVPIQVILNSKAALIGAAYYGAFGAP